MALSTKAPIQSTTIREFTPADFDAVLPIIQQSRLQHQLEPFDISQLQQEFLDSNRFRLVAVDNDGAVVGSGILSAEDPQQRLGRVSRIYITPQHHGTGVGRDLVSQLIEYAYVQNMQQLTLTTRLQFDRAARFYQSLGFSVTHIDPDTGQIHMVRVL
ncbi:MAG: GNAT family N-acetyltransferase [Vampirovibrio sp.]|nr:GNAT family N-acetyltransferase [Vampirovibrio sp.]